MTRKLFWPLAALAAILIPTACGEKKEVDRTPIPATAAPPYLCDYVPLRAVELMTGVHDPLVRGNIDLSLSGGIGSGSCAFYERSGDRLKVLRVRLSPGGDVAQVEEQLKHGAMPLPEILPGGRGYYFRDPASKTNAAHAMLVRNKSMINIQLEIGVEGRDNAADVVALMKLIAPKLITDASAPSESPAPAPTKG